MHGTVESVSGVGLTKVTDDKPAVKIEEKPKLPVFKREWWHSAVRLDARPVIWSLKNRPQDWSVAPRSHTFGWYLNHTPSDHSFILGHTPFFCRMYDGSLCSCQRASPRGKFQRGQKYRFWLAGRIFLHKRRATVDQAHFCNHFVKC